MEIADVKRYTPVHSDAVTSVTVAGDVSYITGSADQVSFAGKKHLLFSLQKVTGI